MRCFIPGNFRLFVGPALLLLRTTGRTSPTRVSFAGLVNRLTPLTHHCVVLRRLAVALPLLRQAGRGEHRTA